MAKKYANERKHGESETFYVCCTCTYIYTHTHTHIYIYIYTHTYGCIYVGISPGGFKDPTTQFECNLDRICIRQDES